MSSMEVNVDMLEQMDLMDMSDHEALDVFLHSGGEDNNATSPVTGGYPVTPPPPQSVLVWDSLKGSLWSSRSRCGVLHRRDQPPGAHAGRAPP